MLLSAGAGPVGGHRGVHEVLGRGPPAVGPPDPRPRIRLLDDLPGKDGQPAAHAGDVADDIDPHVVLLLAGHHAGCQHHWLPLGGRGDPVHPGDLAGVEDHERPGDLQGQPPRSLLGDDAEGGVVGPPVDRETGCARQSGADEEGRVRHVVGDDRDDAGHELLLGSRRLTGR